MLINQGCSMEYIIYRINYGDNDTSYVVAKNKAEARSIFESPELINYMVALPSLTKLVLEKYNAELQEVHDFLDDYNAEQSDAFTFCVFCKSHQYNGSEGVVHKDGCIILKLRKILNQGE